MSVLVLLQERLPLLKCHEIESSYFIISVSKKASGQALRFKLLSRVDEKLLRNYSFFKLDEDHAFYGGKEATSLLSAA